MTIRALTQSFYYDIYGLTAALPCGNMIIDIDPDTFGELGRMGLREGLDYIIP